MKSFKEFLTEMRMDNPKAALERNGKVTEKVDPRNVEIKVAHTEPKTMHDGTVINFPVGESWIRVRRFTSDSPFELTSIQVGSEKRGSATIALALVKRARELADESIVLSDTRSPDGKRLAKALQKLKWTETRDDGKDWVK